MAPLATEGTTRPFGWASVQLWQAGHPLQKNNKAVPLYHCPDGRATSYVAYNKLMAVYKVPQDVEAEDKLVGPFGFRQFIYLGIAVGTGFVAYFLFQVFPLLIIIPLPIIGFFILLALPLRKEQPMETYLLAILRFYLKPKRRLWNPDGTITYVEIVAPKSTDQRLAKEYGAEAASERIGYLARVMDSRGWALKGTMHPGANISNDIIAEAQSAVDVFDEGTSIAQSFSSMIAKKDEERRQMVKAQMQRTAQPAAAPADGNVPAPHFNPYPSSMHQRVIKPIDDTAPAQAPVQQPASQAAQPAPPPAQPASKPPVPQTVSPDIMRLASNDDLSISAIAHEAHRLSDEQDEVVINLH